MSGEEAEEQCGKSVFDEGKKRGRFEDTLPLSR